MSRALSLLLLVALTACSGESSRLDDLRAELRRERAASRDLARDLGRAQAQIRSMEREARKPPPPPPPERFVDLWGGGPTIGGPFLALPRLGTFKWRCDLRHRYFRIVYVNGGATTEVSYDTPGPGRVATLHSGDSLGATIDSGQTVSWTVTHRHPPGFVRARVAVTPDRTPRGNCRLADVRVVETGRHYE